jgi:hypothetical protein
VINNTKHEYFSDVKDAYKNQHSDRKKYLGALGVI